MKNLFIGLLVLSSSCMLPVQKSYGQAALLVLLFGDKAATENFHFSIDGGLNFSNITDLDGDLSLGPGFGLGIYIKINDRWAFVPEFKPLSRRGETGIERFFPISDELEGLESFKSRLKLNYIDIPFLFRYELSPTFFIAGGPQLSIRTMADLYSTGTLSSGKTQIEVTNDLTEVTQWYDLGLALETGLHVHHNDKNTLDVKVRWAPGFVDIAQDELSESSLLNNTWQLIISFPFVKDESEE